MRRRTLTGCGGRARSSRPLAVRQCASSAPLVHGRWPAGRRQPIVTVRPRPASRGLGGAAGTARHRASGRPARPGEAPASCRAGNRGRRWERFGRSIAALTTRERSALRVTYLLANVPVSSSGLPPARRRAYAPSDLSRAAPCSISRAIDASICADNAARRSTSCPINPTSTNKRSSDVARSSSMVKIDIGSS